VSLSADQKEAIMAARGQSAQTSASTTRRYAITFSDGKKCTALDMHGEPEAQAICGITGIFKEGYVVAVEAMRG
jgi:hypothetical protein